MPESLTYLWRLLPVFAAFAAVYITARLLSLKKPSSVMHEVCLFLFWGMIAGVLMMTVVPEPGDIPFADIRNPECYNFIPVRYYIYLYGLMSPKSFIGYFILNAVGNVLVFVPVGFLAKPAVGAGFAGSVGICAGLSLFIELVQIVLPRTTDIDDIILNTLGGVIGAALMCACVRGPDGRKRRKAELMKESQ